MLAVADKAGGFTPQRGDSESGTMGCAAGTPTAMWAPLLSPRFQSPNHARAEHRRSLAVKHNSFVVVLLAEQPYMTALVLNLPACPETSAGEST